MLSDPQKRAAYDQYGHAGVDPNTGGFRGGPGAEGFGGFAEAFGDIFGDIFSGGAAGGARRAGGQQVYRGSDLSYAMEITLEEAAHGKESQIRIPSWEACETCSGSRRQAGHQRQDLPHLQRRRHGASAPGLLQHPADLPALPRHRQDHPRALRHLRRPGQGEEDQDARGEDPRRHQRGHAHPLGRQRRAGHERRAAAAISTSRSASSSTRSSSATATTCTAPCRWGSTTAALGGNIAVPTLGGKAEIELPEGTQHGKTFRLRGKGIKGVRSSYPGDLYCHVSVETPVKLTEHQRKLMKELDESLKQGRRAALAGLGQSLDRPGQGSVQVS